MKLVFSDSARNELESIGDWIANESPTRAISFVHELRQVCFEILAFPNSCPLVPRYETHGIRRKIYGNYLIFYCVAEEVVEVIHILHGAQDYESILFP